MKTKVINTEMPVEKRKLLKGTRKAVLAPITRKLTAVQKAVDDLYHARIDKKIAAKKEADAREIIIISGKDVIKTPELNAIVSQVPYRSLNIDKLRADLGDRLENYYETGTKTLITISKRKDA